MLPPPLKPDIMEVIVSMIPLITENVPPVGTLGGDVTGAAVKLSKVMSWPPGRPAAVGKMPGEKTFVFVFVFVIAPDSVLVYEGRVSDIVGFWSGDKVSVPILPLLV